MDDSAAGLSSYRSPTRLPQPPFMDGDEIEGFWWYSKIGSEVECLHSKPGKPKRSCGCGGSSLSIAALACFFSFFSPLAL